LEDDRRSSEGRFSITNERLIVDQISRQIDCPLFANQLVNCQSPVADLQSFLKFFNAIVMNLSEVNESCWTEEIRLTSMTM